MSLVLLTMVLVTLASVLVLMMLYVSKQQSKSIVTKKRGIKMRNKTFSIGLLTVDMGDLGHVLSTPKTPYMERKYYSYIGYIISL